MFSSINNTFSVYHINGQVRLHVNWEKSHVLFALTLFCHPERLFLIRNSYQHISQTHQQQSTGPLNNSINMKKEDNTDEGMNESLLLELPSRIDSDQDVGDERNGKRSVDIRIGGKDSESDVSWSICHK